MARLHSQSLSLALLFGTMMMVGMSGAPPMLTTTTQLFSLSAQWCSLLSCLLPLHTLKLALSSRGTMADEKEAQITQEKQLGMSWNLRSATARRQHRTWLREKRREKLQQDQIINATLGPAHGNGAQQSAAPDAAAREDEARLCQRAAVKYWHMVSFYKLDSPLIDPHLLAERLRRVWTPMGILGRVYVAVEGVNAQLAVPDTHVALFKQNLTNDDFLLSVFLNFDVPLPAGTASRNDTYTDEEHLQGEDGQGMGEGGTTRPFPKLSIKVRLHVLADGLAPDESQAALDWAYSGRKLSLHEFHCKLDAFVSAEAVWDGVGRIGDAGGQPPIVLDIRNKYEFDVGRFQGATVLDTDSFRETWGKLNLLLEEVPRDAEILTYCTGGIRCEKANAYLIQRLGFQPEGVAALHCCIIHYAQYASAANQTCLFQGVNHVFDQHSGAVGGQRIAPEVLGRCVLCSAASDAQTDCAYKHCQRPFTVRCFFLCASCSTQLDCCCAAECHKALSAQTRAAHALQTLGRIRQSIQGKGGGSGQGEEGLREAEARAKRLEEEHRVLRLERMEARARAISGSEPASARSQHSLAPAHPG